MTIGEVLTKFPKVIKEISYQVQHHTGRKPPLKWISKELGQQMEFDGQTYRVNLDEVINKIIIKDYDQRHFRSTN